MKKFVILILFLILYGCISFKTIDEAKILREQIYSIEYQKDTFNFIVIDSTVIWLYKSPYDKKIKKNKTFLKNACIYQK